MLSNNTTIIAINGRMYATNKLLIELAKEVLKNNSVNSNLINIVMENDYKKLMSKYANIDLTICIGNHDFQKYILSLCKTNIITSGYESFEIYIENINHKDLIDKIIATGLDIKIYALDGILIDYNDVIRVSDIDEAISLINYTGSNYSSAIFTDNKENASKFIKEVKSSMVEVNTSPTIERIIDIDLYSLTKEKTIIYPLTYSFDNERIEI